jgi:hypothetical protein
VEITGPGRVLGDERRADHDTVPRHQAAVRLGGERGPGQNGQDDGEDDAGQQGQYQNAEKGRLEMLAQQREERRSRRLTLLLRLCLIGTAHGFFLLHCR